MKKIYMTLLIAISLVAITNAQTFEFTNSNENFTPTGSAAVTLNATTITYEVTAGRTNFYIDQKTVANGGTSINSANFNKLTIVVKNNSQFTRLNFRNSANTVIGPNLVITTGDTGFKTYEYDFSTDPNWTGTFDGFRIFFGAGTTTSGETIEIDSIIFSQASLSTKSFNAFDFSVFPNPVKDKLNINTNEVLQKISIVDLLGRTVLTPTLTKEINLYNLTKGVYILVLESENGVSTKKILKQ